ncbi:MAG: ABC transporter permease subunit [Devosiaceae bacterium]|nr:ABC transporter permease subunit [Devosiaceae bacterium MH13]
MTPSAADRLIRPLPGLAVVAGLGGFVAIALGALLFAQPGGLGALPFDRVLSPYMGRIIEFTLTQTALSVGLSILGAVPLAVVLARHRRFAGRSALVRLLALPLALPPLVAVLGLLEVWGRSGWVSALLDALGVDARVSIFGLQGVVLAHVFFNLPLAARLMLAHLERQPASVFRLADQLGLAGWARFRRIEAPLLLPHVPAIAGLIAMLCIGSFTIVLTLGGGPSAATLEVAIYQALRFDFDPPLAALLTLMQLCLAGTLLFLLKLAGGAPEDRAGAAPALQAWAPAPGWVASVLMALCAGFIIAPLAGLALSGAQAEWSRILAMPRFWDAALTSFVIAVLAGLLSTACGYALVATKLRGFRRPTAASTLFGVGYQAVGSSVLAIPPIVLGAGWFLLLRSAPEPTLIAAGLIVIVNALMALPFVLRVLEPAMGAVERRYGRLADGLGLSERRRFVRLDGPVMARSFAAGFAFALVLSVGDLGAAALFGAYELETLPILILNLMGSYRTSDAAGVALALGVFVFALLMVADRLDRVAR